VMADVAAQATRFGAKHRSEPPPGNLACRRIGMRAAFSMVRARIRRPVIAVDPCLKDALAGRRHRPRNSRTVTEATPRKSQPGKLFIPENYIHATGLLDSSSGRNLERPKYSSHKHFYFVESNHFTPIVRTAMLTSNIRGCGKNCGRHATDPVTCSRRAHDLNGRTDYHRQSNPLPQNHLKPGHHDRPLSPRYCNALPALHLENPGRLNYGVRGASDGGAP